jgi:hypothetical protein
MRRERAEADVWAEKVAQPNSTPIRILSPELSEETLSSRLTSAQKLLALRQAAITWDAYHFYPRV